VSTEEEKGFFFLWRKYRIPTQKENVNYWYHDNLEISNSFEKTPGHRESIIFIVSCTERSLRLKFERCLKQVNYIDS